MKSQEEIIEEIERRLGFKNPISYSNYRSNNTFIHALFWILGIETKSKSEDTLRTLLKINGIGV